jgi:hypothetical protein
MDLEKQKNGQKSYFVIFLYINKSLETYIKMSWEGVTSFQRLPCLNPGKSE